MKAPEAAGVLSEISMLLEVVGGDPFRAKAYATAARRLEASGADLTRLAAEGRLTTLPGVGAGIAEVLRELVETGQLVALRPPRRRHAHRAVRPDADQGARPQAHPHPLRRAGDRLARQAGGGRARRAPGRAPRDRRGDGEEDHRERRLRARGAGAQAAARGAGGGRAAAGVARHARRRAARRDRGRGAARPGGGRFGRPGRRGEGARRPSSPPSARSAARPRSAPAGDRRRSSSPTGCARAWSASPPRAGRRRCSTPPGAPSTWRSSRRARRRWGCGWRGRAPARREARRRRDEAAVYRALGMAFVEPELREGWGEVEAAAAGTLPRLVEVGDLRGTFHCHTTYSDGRASSGRDGRGGARARLELPGDRRPLAVRRLRGRAAAGEGQEPAGEIDGWNRAHGGKGKKRFRLFKGVESDILADGRLDYDDDVLASFDYVVGSVHSAFMPGREGDDGAAGARRLQPPAHDAGPRHRTAPAAPRRLRGGRARR
jgi:DNA polymerase (family 10)